MYTLVKRVFVCLFKGCYNYKTLRVLLSCHGNLWDLFVKYLCLLEISSICQNFNIEGDLGWTKNNVKEKILFKCTLWGVIFNAVAPVPAMGPVFLRLESRQRDSRLLRLSRLTRTLLKGQQVLGGTTVTDGAL